MNHYPVLFTQRHVIQRRRRTVPIPDEPLNGDANCDGKLSLEDPIRINEYVASRNGNFQTELGRRIKNLTQACRKDLSLAPTSTVFLDPDGNSVVEGIDATFLLDVMVQNFFFATVAVDDATLPSCDLRIRATLANDVRARSAMGLI